jgi:histidinol-phosphate aminotransferase
MKIPENIEKLLRPAVKALAGYVPIEPTDILSKQIDIAPGDIIKLDGNENPYGCSERVRKALASNACYHLYPDPEQRELRKALGLYIGSKSSSIVAGAGSDEIIDLILRLLIEPGDTVINCPPTFGMYKFCTEVCGGEVITIHRRTDFSLDIPSITKGIRKNTKAIFIASPNNPTATLTEESEVIQLLNTGIIVVIDEAYAEFSGITVSNLVPKHTNLIVLRTFSKWAGLAGLRVGYGIFPEFLVPYIMKIKQPYNVNIAAQIAALESLKDIEFLKGAIKAIVKERERLFESLGKIDWLKPYPSKANFILCSVLNKNARSIYESLKTEGIFIRYFDTPGLKDYIRISVGKPEHTDKLMSVLKKL